MKKRHKLFDNKNKDISSEQDSNTDVKPGSGSNEPAKRETKEPEGTDEPNVTPDKDSADFLNSEESKDISDNKPDETKRKKNNSVKLNTKSLVIEIVFSALLLAAICALRTVHLFANNVELVSFSDLGKDLWVYMGISIAVFAILRIFLRRPYFACMIAAFGTFFAVNFDVLVSFMRLFVNKYYPAAILGLVTYVILMAGIVLLLRLLYKKKFPVHIFAKILSLTFAGLVLFNAVMAAVAMSKINAAAEAEEVDAATPAVSVQTTPEVTQAVTPDTTPEQTDETTPEPEVFGQPNIYFFILDEYGSFDMMSKYYDYDNKAFNNFLLTEGFNVSAESYSTDTQTGHSIADLLNLEYISRRLSSSECLSRIKNAPLFTTLTELGYSQFQMSTSNKYFGDIVSLISDEGAEAYDDIINMFGDEEADDIVSEGSISDAFSELLEGDDLDAIMYEDPEGINEWGFYPSSIIRSTDGFKDHELKKYIDSMLGIFDYYEDPSNYNSTAPRVMYTYMTAAHVPFVFNEYGSVLPESQERNWENTGVYLGQYKFISKHMTATISTIIENDPDSIIIIMSDHGVRYHADCNKMHTFYITDKDSCRIMNAVYIKGEQYDIEGLSAINTLRFVLSLYDGLDYSPIEDPITSDSPDSLKGIIPKPR